MDKAIELILGSVILQWSIGISLVLIVMLVGFTLIKGNNVIAKWFRKQFGLYNSREVSGIRKKVDEMTKELEKIK